MEGYRSATPLEVDTCDENGVDWLDASRWVRNPIDEKAIQKGYWFDPERAAWACYWMETQLFLYEDPWAGAPIRFLSTADDPQFFDESEQRWINWDVPLDWEEAYPFYLDRMRRHNQLYWSGAFMHWHAEAVFQVYGWVHQTEDSRPHLRDRHTGNGKIVRRFTKATVWCAKKNGKSPFTAANALYLMCGDGEGGANVGFAAADLSQAKSIIGNHAFEMVAQSATLGEECKTNKNECSVTHHESRSRMFPISAGNERSANAQHGKNLSGGVIDEVHVCSKRVHDRMNRAFISRTEPLLWEVSTSGDNADSWGKTEFDKSVAIQEGKLELLHIYSAVYAAPQDATDEQIEANIEEYLRMANPAMGHIVGLEQSVKDYKEARQSAADLAVFKYEKLNIWVATSVAWLPVGAWASCGGWTFEPEDTTANCVIGFDNAGTIDMAAAVLAWEYWFDPQDVTDPDKLLADAEFADGSSDIDISSYRRRGCLLHPVFWSNERRIEQLSVLVPEIDRWVDSGLIRVCPGNANNQVQIAKDIYDLIQKYNVIGLVHDPWHCDWLVDFWTEGMTDPNGRQVYEPALSPDQIKPMSQGTNTQAGPVASFENAVRRELVGHQDHAVLNWEFDHATVKQDKNGNIQIVKQTRKSHKMVDGCQASVMARWGLLEYGEFQNTRLNFYEHHPLEAL